MIYIYKYNIIIYIIYIIITIIIIIIYIIRYIYIWSYLGSSIVCYCWIAKSAKSNVRWRWSGISWHLPSSWTGTINQHFKYVWYIYIHISSLIILWLLNSVLRNMALLYHIYRWLMMISLPKKEWFSIATELVSTSEDATFWQPGLVPQPWRQELATQLEHSEAARLGPLGNFVWFTLGLSENREYDQIEWHFDIICVYIYIHKYMCMCVYIQYIFIYLWKLGMVCIYTYVCLYYIIYYIYVI